MAELSPTAQAVRHAAIYAGPELEGRLVATLRASAAHLLREKPWSLGVRWSAEELQRIARELEGQG
jgi:hypothetical protein